MIMLSRLSHVLIDKDRTMRHRMQTNEESRIIFEKRSLYNLVAIGNKSTFQAFQYTQYLYDPTYLSFTNTKNNIFNSLYFCFVIHRQYSQHSRIIDIINLTFVFIITIYYITWKACEYIKYVCSANTIKSLQNSSQIIFKPLCYFEHLQQQKSSHSNLSWEFLSYPLLLLLSLLLFCALWKKNFITQKK